MAPDDIVPCLLPEAEFKASCQHLALAWALTEGRSLWEWEQVGNSGFLHLGGMAKNWGDMEEIVFTDREGFSDAHLPPRVENALDEKLREALETSGASEDVDPSLFSQDEAEAAPDEMSHPCQQVILLSFHIILHDIFSVPVLFFRAQNPDGTLLPWNETRKLLPPESRRALEEDGSLFFMSQEPHPLLPGCPPWCCLHPCGTQSFMSLLLPTDRGRASSEPPSETHSHLTTPVQVHTHSGGLAVEKGCGALSEPQRPLAAEAGSAGEGEAGRRSAGGGGGADGARPDLQCMVEEQIDWAKALGRRENRARMYVTAWLSVVGPVVGLQLPCGLSRAALDLCCFT